MAELLLELKHRYQDRYIILDTAPILLFAETQAMSTLVDGVVIVVKEGGVSLKGIAQMLDVLKIATVLGIVYNNAGSASMDGRYHQHYKHYYRDDNHGSKQKDR
jgi:Mrp family chromosome partitioning ATPase